MPRTISERSPRRRPPPPRSARRAFAFCPASGMYFWWWTSTVSSTSSGRVWNSSGTRPTRTVGNSTRSRHSDNQQVGRDLVRPWRSEPVADASLALRRVHEDEVPGQRLLELVEGGDVQRPARRLAGQEAMAEGLRCRSGTTTGPLAPSSMAWIVKGTTAAVERAPPSSGWAGRTGTRPCRRRSRRPSSCAWGRPSARRTAAITAGSTSTDWPARDLARRRPGSARRAGPGPWPPGPGRPARRRSCARNPPRPPVHFPAASFAAFSDGTEDLLLAAGLAGPPPPRTSTSRRGVPKARTPSGSSRSRPASSVKRWRSCSVSPGSHEAGISSQPISRRRLSHGPPRPPPRRRLDVRRRRDRAGQLADAQDHPRALAHGDGARARRGR